MGANSSVKERNRCPVFVVGCHRSGTNLLYDMLLSSGGFAIYRGMLPVYEKLIPRFGDFNDAVCRRRGVDAFIRSNGFRRTGMEAEPLKTKLLRDASGGGNFIQIVMEAAARAQR